MAETMPPAHAGPFSDKGTSQVIVSLEDSQRLRMVTLESTPSYIGAETEAVASARMNCEPVSHRLA